MKKIISLIFILSFIVLKSQTSTSKPDIKLQLITDSIVQLNKIKLITFTITTTSTNTPYAVNNAIASTLTPTGFSLSLGSGNWKIQNCFMTPPTALSTIGMNIAIFSNTVNAQTDHSLIDVYQGAVDQRYLGTIKLNTVWSMGTGTIYEAQRNQIAAALPGGFPIYCPYQTIYIVPYANAIFTPALNQQYIITFILEKTN